MIELGKPGEWTNEQRWKRLGKALRAYAETAAVAILGLAVLIFLSRYSTTILIIGALAVLLVWALIIPKKIVAGKDLMKRSGQAKIGVESERNVRKYIRKAKPLAIVYGLKPVKRGGDIDISVITQKGIIIAVEVKTGFGKVSLEGNRIRAGRNLIFGDPLSQAEKNTKRLATALAVSEDQVLTAVCIPGMENNGFWVDDTILVCSPKQLVNLADKHGVPTYTNPDAVERVVKKAWKSQNK